MIVRLLAVLLLFIGISQADSYFQAKMFRGRPFHGFQLKSLLKKPSNFATSTAQTFDQLVDHTDQNNNKTFEQRYWYNDQYYRAGAPVFIMLGGEAEENPSWLQDESLEWVQLAQQHRAFMFLVEHRYYGKSLPVKIQSNPEDYKFLSSRQAIEDYAYFIKGMKTTFPKIQNAKWIAFGGSYSGSLASWLRLKHPELVLGAVASSGPIEAQVDYVQYMETVMDAIYMYNSTCGDSVGNGFQIVAQLLKTANGRNSLQNTFNLCNPIDPNDELELNYFWEVVYNPYTTIVQYSGDNIGLYRNELTIAHAICKYHTNPNLSPLSKMQAVNNNFYYDMGHTDCAKSRFVDLVQWLNTDDESSDTSAWFYQTCTEFGWYQSTDSDKAGEWFGGRNNLPLSFFERECTSYFGESINSATITASVNETNNFYGGNTNYMGTNVIFVNGDVDPWHAASLSKSINDSVVPILIQGTAHCADMYAAASDDLPGLKSARITIRDTLDKWLNS